MHLTELHNKYQRPLILDGAMGSYLQMKGLVFNDALWSARANVENALQVKQVHTEYIKAGADIITTNTFRTNPAAVKLSGAQYTTNELLRAAVSISKEAAFGNNVIIAGSNAPAEDCYQRERTISRNELKNNHAIHIELLIENGVDIIWNETFSHRDEIEIVSDFCETNKIPYALNIFITHDLKILSGESISDILKMLSNNNPQCIGVNCISPVTFKRFTEEYSLTENWGFYLNCGSGNFTDKDIATGVTPLDYKGLVEKYLSCNPMYVGSCCGSTPEHTRKIKELVLEIYSN